MQIGNRTPRDIVKAVFPKFKGRTIGINEADTFQLTDNYWSDGYRCYYGLVHLQSMTGSTFPGDNPMRHIDNEKRVLPAGYVVVKHTYSGSRQYVTIICHPGTVS